MPKQLRIASSRFAVWGQAVEAGRASVNAHLTGPAQQLLMH